MASRTPDVIWRPNRGPQTAFLASSAFEVLYGGAAGGGKSEALTVGPLRWVSRPDFYAVTFRRETPQLVDLLKKAERYYPRLGGVHKSNPFEQYRFPSGSVVRFGHIDLEKSKTKYQGQEIHLLQFDELTHFTETQYQELVSRVRGGEPRFVRATTNPGGDGHEWVFRRWGPWLDPRCEVEGLSGRVDANGDQLPPAKPGQVVWVVTSGGAETFHAKRVPKSRSRTFIPARIEDNPKLVEEDPEYADRLLDNDIVRYEQLRHGNWLIQPGKGLYFKRGWFELVDAAPAQALRVRYWDRAATEVKKGKNDPDWTVGVRYAWDGSLFYVENVVRMRGNPHEVFETIKNTTELDAKDGVVQCLEQDPGQAGKFEIAAYIAALSRFDVRAFIPSGPKVTRAGPVSAQVRAGNVKIVKDGGAPARWTAPFLQVLEAFPDGTHDDDVDALSGAHMAVTSMHRPRRGGIFLPQR